MTELNARFVVGNSMKIGYKSMKRVVQLLVKRERSLMLQNKDNLKKLNLLLKNRKEKPNNQLKKAKRKEVRKFQSGNSSMKPL
mmetsp:Transcript_30148/g.22410  ORF Transcript_30148/g.22410 Transcript_30148/m.22410 type:complete len:83 (+) Transcript_30148:889-1137(+)